MGKDARRRVYSFHRPLSEYVEFSTQRGSTHRAHQGQHRNSQPPVLAFSFLTGRARPDKKEGHIASGCECPEWSD
jgi:hypothetical protein